MRKILRNHLHSKGNLMKFYKLNSHTQNAKQILQNIGCDKAGIEIMSKKTKTHLLYIEELHVGAANILKQDALSIGADLAVPDGVIIAKDKYVNAVLMGTTKHFEILARKELAQPFGLKELAKQLKSFINFQTKPTKIMGVINANEDSFFEGSRFKESDAIAKIEKMIEDGADIIDIGAVSSRPGSVAVCAEEELRRLEFLFASIHSQKLFEKVNFSIDSYEPVVIEKALDCGFAIVNDISGIKNIEIANLSAKYDASLVIMHMQGEPQTMQQNPIYSNVMTDVDEFFRNKIEIAKNAGVENIILDVGIGFGKKLEHNLELLRHLEHFLHFGYEVLIGASRKSMINEIFPSAVPDRLAGTLAIHLDAVNKGASIVRCHDVYEHKQALLVTEFINKNLN